jgi:two-component system OmpR family sensor kinase
LTLWLWLTLAGVGGICALTGIVWAKHETKEQVDYQMQQVARIIASQPFTAGDAGRLSGDPELIPFGDVQHDQDDDLIVTVRDKQGRLLYASPTNRLLHGGVLPPLVGLGFQTVEVGPDSFRVFVASSRGLIIQVAQSAEAILEAQRHIAIATLLPIGLLLPILVIVLAFAIRTQLRPLNVAAAAIAGRPPLSLDSVPAEGMPAEVRPLVDEINRLLGRLSTAVQREQRFVTDAAHALRTPLTALQLQAEVLEGGNSPEERTERLLELRAGIRRIIRVSEQLLSLARSQSEMGPITVTSDLDSILREAAALYAVVAQGKGIELQVEAGSSARVLGDARRLTLIFGNLLDNAVCFTPAGGDIRIRAMTCDRAAQIEIADEGCGLPPEELERVFERFYQVPGSEGYGSGLGLATVEALLSQLGGRISLANRTDRTGLVATVILPLSPAGSGSPGRRPVIEAGHSHAPASGALAGPLDLLGR